MKVTKEEFEEALTDLLREWRKISIGLRAHILVTYMADKGCSMNEAIRDLEHFEKTLVQMLEASQNIPQKPLASSLDKH